MENDKRIIANYVHNCSHDQIEIKTKAKAISQMGYSDEEVRKIIEFYLLFAPTKRKSSDSEDIFGCKRLKDYGWSKNADMHRLKNRLLSSARMSAFYFIKSDSIVNTLEAMNLGEKICTDHPRSVLKQDAKVKIFEDGSTKITDDETRMECLFRHIRNSIAHNHTYYFDNGNLMLEDCGERKNITARILMPRIALLNWIDIITQNISDLF